MLKRKSVSKSFFTLIFELGSRTCKNYFSRCNYRLNSFRFPSLTLPISLPFFPDTDPQSCHKMKDFHLHPRLLHIHSQTCCGVVVSTEQFLNIIFLYRYCFLILSKQNQPQTFWPMKYRQQCSLSEGRSAHVLSLLLMKGKIE